MAVEKASDVIERMRAAEAGARRALMFCTSKVAAILSEGEENAIPTAEIMRRTRFEHSREVTRCVERERRAGFPICACSTGYYLATDAAEMRRYIRAFERRQRELERTHTALEKTLENMKGGVSE